MAWSLVTFLAVPVIAIEGTGPFETLKRSASLFKSRWGQQITGNIAIGGAVFLFGVALYRYALDGEAVGGFSAEDMESAVKIKKGGRNAPPTATPGTV